MKREIKFRGISIEPLVGGDQWVYGFGVHVVEYTDVRKDYVMYSNNGQPYQVDPETVGQLVYGDNYTGDIFAVVCDCDSEYGCSHPTEKYELVWHERYFQYGFKRGDKFVLLDEFGEENIHKIGSRWDNPDLLEGEKIRE